MGARTKRQPELRRSQRVCVSSGAEPIRSLQRHAIFEPSSPPPPSHPSQRHDENSAPLQSDSASRTESRTVIPFAHRTRTPRQRHESRRDPGTRSAESPQHQERIAAQCDLNATLAAERMTDKLREQIMTSSPSYTRSCIRVSVDKLAYLEG